MLLALVGASPAVHALDAPTRDAPALHGRGCAPSACALVRPSLDERQALLDEADRLMAAHAGDASALGRQCRALGAAMRARVDEVRMLPHMWREVDPEGQLAAVTGDAHPVEPAAGAGRVHIARGYDALNPDRGLDAILETARHEFAHLNGADRRERWGMDEAAELAIACGPR